MPDYIILEGDKAIFHPSFGPATVVVQPGDMKGSGVDTVVGKKMCVVGDERHVAITCCSYMTPQYSIPGMGTLRIEQLGSDQKAQQTKSDGKAVILKGGNFTAVFEVQHPALQPLPGEEAPIADPVPSYTGSGKFMTTNNTAMGS